MLVKRLKNKACPGALPKVGSQPGGTGLFQTLFFLGGLSGPMQGWRESNKDALDTLEHGAGNKGPP